MRDQAIAHLDENIKKNKWNPSNKNSLLSKGVSSVLFFVPLVSGYFSENARRKLAINAVLDNTSSISVRAKGEKYLVTFDVELLPPPEFENITLPDGTKNKGGAHKDLAFNNTIEQRHHMPSQASGNKGGSGGAIVMSIEDHKLAASSDNKPGAGDYRKKQKELIDNGKFEEAFRMDVDDIQSKFPNEYDESIRELEDWYRKNGKF